MIIPNPDTEYFETMERKLEDNQGYCPCRVNKTEDTKCMCREFRERIKNKQYGFCHCNMYLYKEDGK